MNPSHIVSVYLFIIEYYFKNLHASRFPNNLILAKRHEYNSHTSRPLSVKKFKHFIYFICYIKHLGDFLSMDTEKLSKFEIKFLICFFRIADGKFDVLIKIPAGFILCS